MTNKTLLAFLPFYLLTLSAFADYQQDIQADWLLQEKYLFNPTKNITTQLDAAGGCDGIINGKWGFHTNLQKNPWWQIDLGKSQPNRLYQKHGDFLWKIK